MQSRHYRAGYTLLEVLIAMLILALVSVALFQSYGSIVTVIKAARVKSIATNLANEQFEIARNLPFDAVGIVNGIPPGLLVHEQTVPRDGFNFEVITTIRNVDDPFDGTIGSTTNKDLAPADYRLVEINIGCATCVPPLLPITLTSTIGPRNLETTSNNGALFVNVFDATGLPVVGADVHIENNTLTPPIIIDDITNAKGELQIVDVPPGAGAYAISVSKSGYSSERTYPTGDPDNPNPVKQDATVAIQELTNTSFAIDVTSALNVTSSNNTCEAIGDIDFKLSGTKLIGTSPDILKYTSNNATNAQGTLNVPILEWDAYALSLTDAGYDLAGSIPSLPLALNPGVSQDMRLIAVPKNPKGLLVTVKDTATGLPISSADVSLSAGPLFQVATTGRGFLSQTDWSGGSGQADFIDKTRYLSSNGNVDTTSSPGDLYLSFFAGEYQPNGTLISSSFDTGAESNFAQLSWEPQSQPQDTGADSVKLQLATNTDNATWNFIGPDGTAGTYYTLADKNISSAHNGNRYLRYQLYMNSASTTFTPTVSDITFTFSSDCIPSGQTFFSGLSTNDYTLTVEKSGYQIYSGTVTVAAPWQEAVVNLTP